MGRDPSTWRTARREPFELDFGILAPFSLNLSVDSTLPVGTIRFHGTREGIRNGSVSSSFAFNSANLVEGTTFSIWARGKLFL